MSNAIKVQPVMIQNRNVSNFSSLMDGLASAAGEGCLALVTGRAGRGKTATSIHHAAQNACIYLRMATVWASSELEFLRALLVELGVQTPPHRKGPCYNLILDKLTANPQPVFLDELDKLPRYFLDVVRDISDGSAAPFVLVGEAELESLCSQNRRVWSRIFQSMQFAPITASDVMLYAAKAASITLQPGVAEIIHRGSEGDFRLVRRNMISLAQIANTENTREITEKMAEMAIRVGFHGQKGGK